MTNMWPRNTMNDTHRRKYSLSDAREGIEADGERARRKEARHKKGCTHTRR